MLKPCICFIATVSLYSYYDDDEISVITNNNITGGHWSIGSYDGNNIFSLDPFQPNVRTVSTAGDRWPYQVMNWQYAASGWQNDPQLTVTGNMNINILCLVTDWLSRCTGLFSGVATPAVLCHKEPAHCIQSPY